MIYQKLLGASALKPVDIWAVGQYTPTGQSITLPVCFYKPAGKDWQLKYFEPYASQQYNRSFHCGFRNTDDAPGTLYAGAMQRALSNSIPNTGSGALAKSTDYGATWQQYMINDPSGNYLANITVQTCFLATGGAPTAIISGGGTIKAGTILQLTGSTLAEISGYPSGQDRASFIYGTFCLEASQSPTESAILKIASGANQRLELWVSTDGGAHWVVDSLLEQRGDGGLYNALGGGASVTGDKKRFLLGAGAVAREMSLWWSDDAVTWTKIVAAASGGNAPNNSGAAGQSRRKWLLGGAGSFFAAKSQRTSNAGATWTESNTVFNKLRFLGNALYGLVSADLSGAGGISSSRDNGVSWQAEPLPFGTIPGTVVILDIFGDVFST